jgi:AcrR family transcriptional regulator
VARWKNVLKTNDEIYRLKRDAVLRESCRIISKRGFHNTSLDDVARALNVSKGTLYNYVKDKQEILFECHKMALDIGDRAFELAEAGASTAGEALRLVLRQYIATLIDELGACGVITEIDALKPADRKAIVARRDKLEAGFVKLLRQGAADGSLRPIDDKIAIFTFMAALHNVPIWYSPDGRLSGAEIAERMSDILMYGMMSATATSGGDTKRLPNSERRTRLTADL